MRQTRKVTLKSNDADKVKIRFDASYNYGILAEYQEINQILKNVQKFIYFKDDNGNVHSTGVSQNDKDAIRQALKERLRIDLKKKAV